MLSLKAFYLLYALYYILSKETVQNIKNDNDGSNMNVGIIVMLGRFDIHCIHRLNRAIPLLMEDLRQNKVISIKRIAEPNPATTPQYWLMTEMITTATKSKKDKIIIKYTIKCVWILISIKKVEDSIPDKKNTHMIIYQYFTKTFYIIVNGLLKLSIPFANDLLIASGDIQM